MYTIWSKGRLLGHTTLDFCPCVTLGSRMGWFEPTEEGKRLMPSLTTLGRYHEAITREVADRSLPSGEPVDAKQRRALARAALDYKVTEEAGVALRDLELEMHDDQGNVVPTTHIAMQDTEYLLALASDDDWEERELENLDEPDAGSDVDEFSAALIELGVEEPPDDDWDFDDELNEAECDWESSASTLPRYQIFVDLVDGKSVPVSDRWKDDPYVRALVAGHDPFADRSDEADCL